MKVRLVASQNGADGSLLNHQDARIYLSYLDVGVEIVHDLAAGRYAWLQILRGSVTLNGTVLDTSDGAAVSEELRLTIRASTAAEIMLFDLA